MSEAVITAPLTVTESALGVVLEVRASEPDPANTALRVAITGSNMTEFSYALDLVSLDEAADDDLVYTQGDHGELSVIVPADSAESLNGASLDVPSTGQGLVIKNPNTPDPLAGLDLQLEGDLATQAQMVLEQAVNPALASHGGFATLVGVDGNNVVVTMGGGCQGCASSTATLKQGVEQSIRARVPGVVEILDTTDHAAGTNPYYSPAY